MTASPTGEEHRDRDFAKKASKWIVLQGLGFLLRILLEHLTKNGPHC